MIGLIGPGRGERSNCRRDQHGSENRHAQRGSTERERSDDVSALPSEAPEANAQPPGLLREVRDGHPPDELEIERVANAGLKRDQASEVEDGEQRADREPGRASGTRRGARRARRSNRRPTGRAARQPGSRASPAPRARRPAPVPAPRARRAPSRAPGGRRIRAEQENPRGGAGPPRCIWRSRLRREPSSPARSSRTLPSINRSCAFVRLTA